MKNIVDDFDEDFDEIMREFGESTSLAVKKTLDSKKSKKSKKEPKFKKDGFYDKNRK